TAGLEPLGAYATSEEFQRSKGYTICDVNGVKVAIVAFTKGVGSRGLPVGSEDCVNLLYTDFSTDYKEVDTAGIKRILQAAASEKPDITIALLHWGQEDNDVISSTQKEIITLMQRQGVDVIIGTHPHRVQEVVYDEIKGTLVAYSLGDFFGDGAKSGTNYSIVLDIEIVKDYDTGLTQVVGFDYIPVYTLTPQRDGEAMRVVRVLETMTQYENNHINKVGSTAYTNIKAALAKIKSKAGLYE
ncbi:MAG: CapA family protein, partial [Oscillospiraceae bacterium]|nr:CapA family protein [Oscillospiraceae bacterium]